MNAKTKLQIINRAVMDCGQEYTSTDYVRDLKLLGLTPYSAGQHLGIGRRQSMRYAAGTQPVSGPVALLIAAYLRHGLPAIVHLPPPWQSADAATD